MPVAPVDDKGTELYYVDTGPVEGKYLTVVLVHGTAFHGAIFHRMLPFAAPNGLRLVVVNRRDYPGSTRLTDEDLAALASPDDETRAEYFRQRGLELDEFLAWYGQHAQIPPYTVAGDGKEEGGIVLLGWSSATTYVLSLLAWPDRIPEKTQHVLTPYFRAVCALDPGQWAFGIPDPPGIEKPHQDESVDPAARVFQPWVSGYYAHANIHSGDIATLSQQRMADPPASFDIMTSEEKDAVVQKDATTRSETLVATTSPAIYYAQITRALDKSTAHLWLRCEFKLLWCEQSLWETVAASWEVRKLYAAKQARGDAGRNMTSVSLPRANHFVHWDKPEEICKCFASVL